MSKILPEDRKLDLAPTSRGSCKGCKGIMKEGTCRVMNTINSRFHDGFDNEFYHIGCKGYAPPPRYHPRRRLLRPLTPWPRVRRHGATSIAKIRNLGEVRFSEQLELLEQIGHKVSKNCVGGPQNAASDAVMALMDELANKPTKPKDVKEFLEHNGIAIENSAGKGKGKYEAAYEAADALLYGKPGPCPICDGTGVLRSLYPATESEPTVQCHGLLEGGKRCGFGVKEVRKYGGSVVRERVEIPPSLLGRKGFFKDYELPAAVEALPGGPPTKAAPAPTGAAAAAVAPKGKGKGSKKRKGGKNAAGGGAAAAEAPPKRKKLKGDEESLKVHAEAPQGKIYVGEGGTCAYNVTLSQADLESGINKFCKIVVLSRLIRCQSR